MYMMNLEKLGSQNMCGLIDFVEEFVFFFFSLRAKGNQWRLKQKGGDGMIQKISLLIIKLIWRLGSDVSRQV